MTPENISLKTQNQSDTSDSCCDSNCSCHSSDKNLIKVLSALVIICLLSIIALTYLLLKQPQLTQDKQLSLKSKATSSTLDIELKETSDMTEWKTLQIDTNINQNMLNINNKKLEIKYPQNWYLLPGKKLGGTEAGNIITSFYTDKIIENPSSKEIQIEIYILLSPNESLDDFVNNYSKSGIKNPTKININGFYGYKGYNSEKDSEIIYLLQINDNNIAHIYVSNKDSELINTFDQILSTFKFNENSEENEIMETIESYFENNQMDLASYDQQNLTKFLDNVYSFGYGKSNSATEGEYILIGKVNNEWIIPEYKSKQYCDWVIAGAKDTQTITFMGCNQ